MRGECESRRLADVAIVVMGQSPPGPTYNEEGRGLPFFQGVKDFSDRYPRKRVYCTAPTRFAEPGDILFSVRAPIGEINRAAERCCIGRGLAAIRGLSKYDTDYLEYVLRSIKDEWHILEGQGAVFGNAKKSDLENLVVPWPEEEERRAIAHILGTLDDKIELNRRMNETLEAMARALFKSWFVDFDPVVVNALKAGNPIPGKFAERAAHYRDNPDALGLPEHILRLFPDRFVDSELGPIPEGWEVKALSTVATLHTETISPRSKPKVIWEHYSIPAFDERKMPNFESGTHIKSGKYKVPSSAVLASKLNPQFPRVWLPQVINEDRAICSTEFMPFVPIKAEWRPFLYELLKSDSVQKGIRGAATGSTGSRQRVKPKTVASLIVVVAPEGIIDSFCDRMAPVHNLVLSNQLESRTLATLRDALLPKLISGELRVPDVEKILEGVE